MSRYEKFQMRNFQHLTKKTNHPMKSKTKYNHKKTIRIPEDLLKKIEASEGGEIFTKWMLEAAHAKLESEQGLTVDYKNHLVLLLQNLISQGRNLNQLARSSEEGKPTHVNDVLLKDLLQEIQTVKKEVVRVGAKL